MATINFGGVEEKVVTREEFPLEKAREVLSNETVAVIGYGVQGPGQALNQKTMVLMLSLDSVKTLKVGIKLLQTDLFLGKHYSKSKKL